MFRPQWPQHHFKVQLFSPRCACIRDSQRLKDLRHRVTRVSRKERSWIGSRCMYNVEGCTSMSLWVYGSKLFFLFSVPFIFEYVLLFLNTFLPFCTFILQHLAFSFWHLSEHVLWCNKITLDVSNFSPTTSIWSPNVSPSLQFWRCSPFFTFFCVFLRNFRCVLPSVSVSVRRCVGFGQVWPLSGRAKILAKRRAACGGTGETGGDDVETSTSEE